MFNFRSNRLERTVKPRESATDDRISRRRRSRFPRVEIFRPGSRFDLQSNSFKRFGNRSEPVNWISRAETEIVFTFAKGTFCRSLNALTVEHHLRNANARFCDSFQLLASERASARTCVRQSAEFAVCKSHYKNPMTPQARRAPADPVFVLSSVPPRPRSSDFSWTTRALPIAPRTPTRLR